MAAVQKNNKSIVIIISNNLIKFNIMRITDEELELIREQQTKIAQIKQDIGTLELRKHEVMGVMLDVNQEVEETKLHLKKSMVV